MCNPPSIQTLLNCIPGVAKAYFQPPESIKLIYPCIIYSLNKDRVLYANNKKYKKMDQYTLTLIDYVPNSSIRSEIEKLDYCSFDRCYSVDNLYHYVFTFYYK